MIDRRESFTSSMSIQAVAKRRSIVRRAKAGSEGSRVGSALLLPRVFDHQVDELNQMLAKFAHPDALNAGVGAFEQHPEQIGGEVGILETSGLAKSYDPLVLARLVLLNDTSRGMLRVGKLGERVPQRGSAFLQDLELGRGSPTPVLEQPLRIAVMVSGQIAPFILLVRDHAAHPLGDELVLRIEVAVEGHLVGASRFGDRFDPYAANPLLMKQIAGGDEDALADGQPFAAFSFRFSAVPLNICFHVRLYPRLTKMLPIGNIGVPAACYRPVTYYQPPRIIATSFGLPSRSPAT